jgi:hypothetical protein
MKALRLTNAQLKARSRVDLNARFAQELRACGIAVLDFADWTRAAPTWPDDRPVFVAEFPFQPARSTWDYRKIAVSQFVAPRWCMYEVSERRRWRIDFAWPAQRLGVEIDGGSYIAGAHSRGPQTTRDNLKRCEMAIDGWRLLRIDGTMIRHGVALAMVRRALAL